MRVPVGTQVGCVPVNWARLPEDALGLGPLAYGPVRTRLVDARSTGTIEIAEGVWILLGEAGRFGDDVISDCLLARER
jgi:hypothetical protein